MDREKFSELLPSTQAKFLRTKGTQISDVDRKGERMTLYSLGKHFYEVTVNSYQNNNVVRIAEVNADNVARTYSLNNT